MVTWKKGDCWFDPRRGALCRRVRRTCPWRLARTGTKTGTIETLAEPETLWVMKRVRDVFEFTSSLLRISGWKLT